MTLSRSTYTAFVALPVVAALTLTGCADNKPSANGSTKPVTVTITDTGCETSADSFPSGKISFEISNKGTVPNEFEILTENKLQIASEVENIGPGTSRTFTTALSEGTYYTACKPNMVGNLVGVKKLTVTKGAEVKVDDDVKKLEEQAVTNYTAYVRDQAGQLLASTKTFVEAYKAGKDDEAKALFGPARQPYERIEPTAEAFGIKQAGDVDAALDSRIQDLAADAGKAVTDPEVIAKWTGWHRIEADLWTADKSSPFHADTAKRAELGDQLLKDTQNLYDLVYGKVDGAKGKFELKLTDVVTGSSALMEEVATSKIVGEEDTFSHTDLYDFKANVEGAQVAYGNVKALVEKKDPELAKKIDASFVEVFKLVDAHASGTNAAGQTTYVDYSTIATVQKNAGEAPKADAYTETQKKFSDAVNGLSESLSKIAEKVLH
mgnify:FL=1